VALSTLPRRSPPRPKSSGVAPSQPTAPAPDRRASRRPSPPPRAP